MKLAAFFDLKSHPFKEISSKLTAVVLSMLLVLSCLAMTGCSTESSTSSASSQSSQSSSSASTANEIKVSVNISGQANDIIVEETSEVDVESGATVLDALQATGIDVVVEDSSYGAYVTSIDGLKSEGSAGWTYTVNDQMIMESASSYVLENGDVIEWEYVQA